MTVTGGETPLPEGGFALWPNPASEYVDIRVPGAAGTVAVRIYDASARQVFDGTVTPDADGVGRLEVAAPPEPTPWWPSRMDINLRQVS